jgi:hypothetical protein
MTSTAYGYKWGKLRARAKQFYPPYCHLCRGEIDTTLGRRDPMCWTLDHLYPVAIHGDTVPDLSEVRPAHRKCNERRGTQPLAPSPRSEDW